MNEDRLSSLLKEFAQPISATNVQPVYSRPRRTYRFGLAGLGLAAAFAGGLVLLPRSSNAGVLYRIENAISNAQSMVVTSTSVNSNGKKRVFSTTWYQSGRWRSDIFQGLPIAKTFIIRDGEQFILSPNHKTLTEEQAGEWTGISGKVSALDFAKMQTDQGEISEARNMSVQPHDPVDGRPTYLLAMSRPSDHYRSEILIDKATNLPIRSETWFDFPTETQQSHELIEYRFNEPIPAETFDPRKLGTPVQDLTAQQVQLMEKWSKPRYQNPLCQIRDVWQNSEGEVFVAYTCKKGTHATPDTVEGVSGTTYLPVADISPGMIRGDTSVNEVFKFEGLDARIAVWAPVEKPTPLPSKVSLDFAGVPKAGEGPLCTLPIATATSDEWRPPYATTLVLNDYLDQMAFHLADVRADWYRKKKDFVHELPWRRIAYQRAREWLPSFADRTYKKPIDRCLRDLGQAP